MNEMIKNSFAFLENYWGEGFVMWLFAAAAVYLLIISRKKKNIRYVLFYSVIVLAVFFCPISADIIQKCIGATVYWRVLWLLPVVPVIALAMTEFLRRRKNQLLQFVLVLVCIGAIAVCGKGIYQAGNYRFVHNYQQVPDEVAAICEMVKADAGDAEYLLAADNYIGPYIRVYDPSIYMMFNRESRGNAGGGARNLYLQINAPVLNYADIGWAGKRTSCNYLVVKNPNEKQKEELNDNGYQEVGAAGRYSLYRLGDSAESVRNIILDNWNWW